jgi:hypothetical protein
LKSNGLPAISAIMIGDFMSLLKNTNRTMLSSFVLVVVNDTQSIGRSIYDPTIDTRIDSRVQ